MAATVTVHGGRKLSLQKACSSGLALVLTLIQTLTPTLTLNLTPKHCFVDRDPNPDPILCPSLRSPMLASWVSIHELQLGFGMGFGLRSGLGLG